MTTLTRGENGSLTSLVRVFKHRGIEYEIQVHPATIVKGSTQKQYYPGVREEIVEDALRKIATEGKAKRINKKIGLEFSLYELKAELRKAGHTYSHEQIKDSLMICSRTVLTLKRSNNKAAMIDQPMFPFLGVAEGRGRGGSDLAIVEFNALVTRSIEEKSFRQLNYERSMKISNSLARWLHKRMSHNYTQAKSFHNAYKIRLTTIIRDSGMTPYQRLSDSRKYVCKALDELQQLYVVYQYSEEANKEGRKLVDVVFTLNPSIVFSKEMKRANAIMKSIS